ncbi:hypothetical protein P4V41_07430 [Fictibacillus nanhaiensis]|uniref:hypothetical protein n=1 Tax=Fictibacillus nanhaiensis TaxID=742169 RepID=UPI002E241F04|nr:hypothetical protein [Fictibacillus nanhaiensis]
MTNEQMELHIKGIFENCNGLAVQHVVALENEIKRLQERNKFLESLNEKSIEEDLNGE